MTMGDPVLVMTRVLDAPRATVFDGWLDPDRLMRWWAPPRAVRVSPARIADVGDAFRFRVRAPDGGDRWLTVAYREIVAPERLVFTWGGDAPETQTMVTVEFAEHAGKTTVTLRQVVLLPETPRDQLERHYAARLDRLAALLRGAL